MLFRVSSLRLLLVALVAVGLGALAGCGAAARSEAAPVPEVQVTAAEFSFVTPQTSLKVNAPYRFVVTNAGKTIHEWVLREQGTGGHAHDQHDAALSAIGSQELGPSATASREVVFL